MWVNRLDSCRLEENIFIPKYLFLLHCIRRCYLNNPQKMGEMWISIKKLQTTSHHSFRRPEDDFITFLDYITISSAKKKLIIHTLWAETSAGERRRQNSIITKKNFHRRPVFDLRNFFPPYVTNDRKHPKLNVYFHPLTVSLPWHSKEIFIVNVIYQPKFTKKTRNLIWWIMWKA